ncbi:hypothetical protein [Helicobacter cetorum]|uniref:Uncharacterized protein n=1 Tax=Helicobacter cetorum (strain ATCC BAA-429 / MIT 00-7128) TaxID=182217 RepID=I0EPC7_HELC0|nr:hypothetical protein [Helicobacter cetorum]AFI04796.1 hypothetical protein HCW_07690 [Helicobacter cetorum MIT 00-7128]
MGFWNKAWDLTKKGAKYVGEGIRETQIAKLRFKEEFVSYSDKQLFEEMKDRKWSESGFERQGRQLACAELLKERGYTGEEIAKYNRN